MLDDLLNEINRARTMLSKNEKPDGAAVPENEKPDRSAVPEIPQNQKPDSSAAAPEKMSESSKPGGLSRVTRLRVATTQSPR